MKLEREPDRKEGDRALPLAGLPVGKTQRHAQRSGSVLIIVLWIAFGLVSITLYFAQSMTFELRASDNRLAAAEADAAIDGAARYVNYLLTNLGTNGTLPDVTTYQREAVPVGQANFWLLGRSDRPGLAGEPFFGLIDEASKMNLNTATTAMLEALPRMTPALAAAIVDWRDSNSDLTVSGAEMETYARLRPPYTCKNALFETTDELRLVFGMDLDLLYGEDSNLNGALDLNENDGIVSLPNDDRDGRLKPGLIEYLTVYSREPNTRTNVNNARQLAPLLQQKFSVDRANAILRQIAIGGPMRSLVEFFVRSRMTSAEFAQIESDLTVTNSAYVEGLINVNTASAEVLAGIPGIGTDKAASVVSYRQSNPDKLTSVAWVVDVLEQAGALQAGPYITARSYQCTADIAATGHYGRGYRRARFIFDTSEGTPKILYRQDLSHLGWALGKQARRTLLLAKERP